MLKNTKYTWAVLALIVVSSSTFASGKDRPCKRLPPVQAIEACQSKSEDESCSFQDRRHKVEGICFSKLEKIVCVPNHHLKRMKLHEEIVYPQYQRQDA